MKKIIVVLMSLSMLVVGAATSASAQITDRLVVKIPFDFTVRNKTLPAGKYFIKRLDGNPEDTLEIQNADGKNVVIFLGDGAITSTAPDKTELIFNHVGEHYFLSEIFESGNSLGVELEKSRAEKKLEKQGLMSEKQTYMLTNEDLTLADD